MLPGLRPLRNTAQPLPALPAARPTTHLQIVMTDQLPAGHPRSLEGFTLKRVAHFLRFLYHPSEVTAIDFHLPGQPPAGPPPAGPAAATSLPAGLPQSPLACLVLNRVPGPCTQCTHTCFCHAAPAARE